MTAPFPPNEISRLSALRDLKILGTSPEAAFDDLTRLAALICDAPIAGISLVDEHRLWFKSRVGIDAAELPRDNAFCAHALLAGDVLVIPDAPKDPRFADNPFVTSGPRIRLYAGAPLVSKHGYALGAICVMDTSPRELRPEQVEALRILARQAMALLDLREAIGDAAKNAAERARAEEERDKALAASRDKSAFLSAMNHELRTPLNAIIGYSELLEEEMTAPEQEAYLHDIARIKASATRLLGMIDNIVDAARLELGKVTLRPETIHVETLLSGLREAAAPLAEKTGSSLEIRCDPGAGEIVADRARLRQCLTHLLTNAAKFTNEGSISLSAERAREGGREVIRFAVADTGIGIAPNTLEQIHDELSQTDATAPRRYGGTGVGLTIARRVCRLMGGSLGVKSEVGRGSTFTITLPTTEEHRQ